MASLYLRNPRIRDNLIQNKLSDEQLRAACSRAGRKSGEVRRKKKLMREMAREILNMKLKNEDEFRIELKARGIEQTEAAAVLLAQLTRARRGDTDAARFLRDTSGQKPSDNVIIDSLNELPFQTVDLSKLSDEQLRALV